MGRRKLELHDQEKQLFAVCAQQACQWASARTTTSRNSLKNKGKVAQVCALCGKRGELDVAHVVQKQDLTSARHVTTAAGKVAYLRRLEKLNEYKEDGKYETPFKMTNYRNYIWLCHEHNESYFDEHQFTLWPDTNNIYRRDGRLRPRVRLLSLCDRSEISEMVNQVNRSDDALKNLEHVAMRAICIRLAMARDRHHEKLSSVDDAFFSKLEAYSHKS